MSEKHQRQIDSITTQIAKILDLDEDEKNVLEAGVGLVESVAAAEAE